MILPLLIVLTLLGGCSNNKIASQSSSSSNGKDETMNSKILFINSSEHSNGNTAQMGMQLLDNYQYKKIDLINYRIGFLGQKNKDDELFKVFNEIKNSKTLVIGTPVYWHSMSGALKTFIDRSSDNNIDNPFEGKHLYFFLQGSAPTELSKESILYSIKRFADQTGMILEGTATNDGELNQLKLKFEEIEK